MRENAPGDSVRKALATLGRAGCCRSGAMAGLRFPGEGRAEPDPGVCFHGLRASRENFPEVPEEW